MTTSLLARAQASLPALAGLLLLSGCPSSSQPSPRATQGEKQAQAAAPKTPTTARTPPTAAILAQMRWPLDDLSHPAKNNPYGKIEQLIIAGDPSSLATAAEKLAAAVRETPGTPQETITEIGTETAESTAKLNRQIDLCYEYALLYAVTGEESHAREAAAIMLRFAEVMPHWRLTALDGKVRTQDNRIHLRHWRANAFWKWHPLDLAVTLPMLRAYDLIRPALADEQKETIRTGLFFYHKDFLDRFTGLLTFYSNLAGYHLLPSIRVGQVLERPDYIEQALNYWKEFMQYSYAPDGFFRELTPDYHTQITWRMIDAIPATIKAIPDRSLSLPDLAQEHAPQIAQIRAALSVLSLPDGTFANVNDSWPKKALSGLTPEEAGRPGLLGITGAAKLGTPGMAALMQFDGIRGHDHHDALSLIWFAAGAELFSDTGYQPIEGSDSTRRWHTISASHNTVVVNEQTQFENRAMYALPNRGGAFAAFPPKTKGQKAPIEAANPAAAGFYNQGRLLIWDGSDTRAQAMEAEQERAYGGTTTLYRRTLVMVPVAGDEGYLVDLFRVRGGQMHDFMLRPGLDESASLQFGLSLQPTEGLAHEYIRLKGRAAVTPPMTAEMSFPSGGQQLHSTLVQLFSETPGGSLELLVGEGPAIRRMGSAPFSFLRHRAGSDEALESWFVWVHEATRGASRIRKAEAKKVDDSIILTVQLEGRTDTLISALDPDSEVQAGDFSLKGKLAFVSEEAGRITSRLHHGTLLQKNGETLAEGLPPLKGEVVGTLSQAAGDATHSLLIRPTEKEAPSTGYPSHLAQIDLGDAIRFSIPITRVTEREDGLLQVDLVHEPGFIRNEGEIVMTRFPGWRIQARPVVSLE